MNGNSLLVRLFCPLLGATLILLTGAALIGQAQPAALDTTFRADAIVDGHLQAIALQPDGQIVIVGQFSLALADATTDVAVIRLNDDGSLDSGFSLGNALGRIEALAIQPDGKIVITGDYLQRLNSDGSLDPQFSLVPLEPTSLPTQNFLSLQADGKIVVGGSRIRRFNADGRLDLNFHSPENFSANVVLAQPDQKIVVSGIIHSQIAGSPEPGAARRLNRDGSLDLELGPNALAIQSDGKFISLYNEIRRINPDGTLDESFQKTSPWANFEQVYVIAIQRDGKILIGGRPQTHQSPRYKYILRLEANGEVDLGFDSSIGIDVEPVGVSYVAALAVDAKGRILVGGVFRHFVGQPVPPLIRLKGGESLPQPLRFIHPPQNERAPAAATVELTGEALGYPNPRYQWLHDGHNIPGATNSTLRFTRVQLSDFGTYRVLATNSLGSISAEASLDVSLLTNPGSLDVTFHSCDGDYCQLDLLLGCLRSGKLLVQRLRTDVGRLAMAVELLNQDGTTQRWLPIEAAISGLESVYSASFAEQPDGKIVLLGRFVRTTEEPVNNVLRFTADGELDSTFEPVTVNSYTRFAVAVSPDSQIYFTDYRGDGSPVVMRARPDGRIDPSFTVGFQPSSSISVVRVQNDGNLLVAGRLSMDRKAWKPILRFSPDGAADSTFDIEVPPDSYVLDVLIQSDGKLLLQGAFPFTARATALGV